MSESTICSLKCSILFIYFYLGNRTALFFILYIILIAYRSAAEVFFFLCQKMERICGNIDHRAVDYDDDTSLVLHC